MKNMFTYLSYLPKKLFMFIATTLAIVGLGVVVQATFGPDKTNLYYGGSGRSYNF